MALAGCGGGHAKTTPAHRGGGEPISADNYQTVVQQVTSEVQKVAADRPPANAGLGPQVRYARALQTAARQAHDALARLAPPGRLAQANGLIVGAFGRFVDLLGALVRAGRSNDKAAIGRIETQIRAETATLDAALRRLHQGG